MNMQLGIKQIFILLLGVYAILFCLDIFNTKSQLLSCKDLNDYDQKAFLKGNEIEQCIYLNTTTNTTCSITKIRSNYIINSCEDTKEL